MKAYLVFRLYGPMASWGQPAVGGERPTELYPGRSAILGLLGAALGIRRDDESELAKLQKSVLIAIKQTVPGSLMRDYHTTQVPTHNSNVVHQNRKSELRSDRLNTILSNRDYRCDGIWIVAITLTEHTGFTLEQLRDALLKPVFILHLGRKSCPLALPLCPKLITSSALKTALDIPFPPLIHSDREDRLWLGANGIVTYFWEGNKDEMSSSNILISHPWDEPINRARWQFRQRTMYQLSIEESVDVFV
ncbi:type I-E CRISPR-associated protein Cas5/CasD [Photorhabdus akhurstii]|uniref:type I-E CRISPR-associated protein Cas5/CasD n=1 Tax=Photorhabdus akhurstii TaxID=171438 RepID=UPI00052D7CC8|nr:type I-E CRISPR-associated protein Cas5/CasD [Photorhabdus akhurstii]KGM28861.1 CRISPR-associated protein Cas5 [Photorhabdus luminescens]MBS9430172.1 type I-E CRISPR-associated protein Cas5/CasD [Photorhabdus akhurstii]PQQ42104.1 type I-E CRISPR-associated protein Cas5/CasD [Photorhabdus luminescens]